MIALAKGLLSKSMGAIGSSGSTIKALAGSHPVSIGIALGIGAYYVVNKYWLNDDDESAMAEGSEAEKEKASA